MCLLENKISYLDLFPEAFELLNTVTLAKCSGQMPLPKNKCFADCEIKNTLRLHMMLIGNLTTKIKHSISFTYIMTSKTHTKVAFEVFAEQAICLKRLPFLLCQTWMVQLTSNSPPNQAMVKFTNPLAQVMIKCPEIAQKEEGDIEVFN